VLAAIQVAGTFLDTFNRLLFGALVDPLTGSQSSIISQLYGLVGVMVFHRDRRGRTRNPAAIARTYELVPLVEFPALGPLTPAPPRRSWASSLRARACRAGDHRARADRRGFGLMARVLPQLNVFSVGFRPDGGRLFLIIVTMPSPAAGSPTSSPPARRHPRHLPAELDGGREDREGNAQERDQARKKGQVARSMDVNGAVVLAASVAGLAIFGPRLFEPCARR
jgi:hypothetical protein